MGRSFCGMIEVTIQNETKWLLSLPVMVRVITEKKKQTVYVNGMEVKETYSEVAQLILEAKVIEKLICRDDVIQAIDAKGSISKLVDKLKKW